MVDIEKRRNAELDAKASAIGKDLHNGLQHKSSKLSAEQAYNNIFIEEIKASDEGLARFYELNPALIGFESGLSKKQIQENARVQLRGFRLAQGDLPLKQELHKALEKINEKLLKLDVAAKAKLVNQLKADAKDEGFNLFSAIEKYTGIDCKNLKGSILKKLGGLTGGDKDKNKSQTESEALKEMGEFTSVNAVNNAIKGCVYGSISTAGMSALPFGSALGGMAGSGAGLFLSGTFLLLPGIVIYDLLKYSPFELPIIGSKIDKGPLIGGTLDNLFKNMEDVNYFKPIVLPAQEHNRTKKSEEAGKECHFPSR